MHEITLARPLKERRRQFPIGSLVNDISFQTSSVSPRKRLFKLLDAFSSEPVTWVTGPPGSGKTSLVRSYVQVKDFRCHWFALDEGTLASGSSEDWRQFFLDVSEQVAAGSVLVFDNVHHISDTAPLFEVFVKSMPLFSRKTRIIFISRRNPPPAFIRLHANQLLGLVGWGDLQFTQEEFYNIPEQPWMPSLLQGSRSLIYEKLDGWIAGLHLLKGPGKNKAIPNVTPCHEDHRKIFEYFEQEIFQLLTPEEQGFLLQVALFSTLSPKRAEILTENFQSREILEGLERANIFIEKRGGAHPFYRFHALFREYLLDKGARELKFAAYRKLQEKAALLMFHAGDVEDGIAILARAGSWQGLSRKTVDHASSLMKSNLQSCVGSLIMDCPVAMIDNDPWLAFWHGASLLSENWQKGRATLEKTSEIFKARREDRGFWMCWTVIVESYFFEGGCFEGLDRWLEVGHRQASKREFFSPEFEARVTGTMVAAMLFRRPQCREFNIWLNRAEAMVLRPEIPRNQRLTLRLHAMQAYCCRGSVEKAEQFLPDMMAGAGWNQLPLVMQVMRQSLTACHAWQKADFAESVETVEQHMGAVGAENNHVIYVHLFAQGIIADLGQENLQRAKKFLGKMVGFISEDRPYGMAIQYFLKALICSHCYEHQKALNFLDRAEKIALCAGVPWLEMEIQAAKGLFLTKVGKIDEAFALLEAALGRSRILGSIITELTCFLYLANILFIRGDERAAMESMQSGFALGREHGLYHWPLWDREICSFLFVRALEAGVEKKYVTKLIRAHQSGLVAPPLGFGHWYWPLRIYTMGRFSVLRDEEQIDSGTRGQRKPIILLQALIALGGRNVADMRLADILWPDADGDMQLQTLRTTLHRLRQLLGFKEAIVYVDGQLTLNSTYCWVDTWAFERLLGDAEKFWKYEVQKGKPEGVVYQAFSFYQGAFLPHKEHEHWTIFLRERLRQKFIINTEMLGCHLEKENRWQDAVHCYQKALSIDPLVEACYQRLMICFLHMGRPSEAVATYHRCHQLLTSAIGIEPSRETTRIFQDIQNS